MTQEVAGRFTLDLEGRWEEEAGKDTVALLKACLHLSVCLCVCGHDLLMLWEHTCVHTGTLEEFALLLGTKCRYPITNLPNFGWRPGLRLYIALTHQAGGWTSAIVWSIGECLRPLLMCCVLHHWHWTAALAAFSGQLSTARVVSEKCCLIIDREPISGNLGISPDAHTFLAMIQCCYQPLITKMCYRGKIKESWKSKTSLENGMIFINPNLFLCFIISKNNTFLIGAHWATHRPSQIVICVCRDFHPYWTFFDWIWLGLSKVSRKWVQVNAMSSEVIETCLCPGAAALTGAQLGLISGGNGSYVMERTENES